VRQYHQRARSADGPGAAERFKERPDLKKYHAAAWPVIRHPYANVFMCRFALAQTNSFC